MNTNAPGDDCDWAILKLGEEELMLNTAFEKEFRPPAPAPRRIAAHIDTMIYFSCPDVASTYQHLVAAGVTVEPPSITGYRIQSCLCE